jgi:hypothetical protein
MTKWEYTISYVVPDGGIGDHLNRMGDAGWEMVAVVMIDTGSPAAFFKRPKVEARDP